MRTRRARLSTVVLASTAAVLAACSSSGGSTDAPSSARSFTPTSTAAGVSTPVDRTNPGPSHRAASSSPATPGPGTSSTPPTKPAPAKPLTTLTVQGQHATYKIKVWAQDRTTTCDDHAYGQQVITFLTTHPCRGIYRRIATTTVGGRPVGFDQSQLSFSGADPVAYRTAGNFQTLVSQDGTGSIDDLLRDGYRLPGGPTQIPTPDAFKALSQDSAVTITDAWYLDGDTPENDPPLTTMAEDLFLQF